MPDFSGLIKDMQDKRANVMREVQNLRTHLAMLKDEQQAIEGKISALMATIYILDEAERKLKTP